MYKIVYIVPYFGKMRSDFNIWLKSCSYNKSIDFLIFTDDCGNYDYPANVHMKYITLPDLKLQIEDKLGFNIAMSHPYKLCDFKPAYGDIFSDYITEYDETETNSQPQSRTATEQIPYNSFPRYSSESHTFVGKLTRKIFGDRSVKHHNFMPGYRVKGSLYDYDYGVYSEVGTFIRYNA